MGRMAETVHIHFDQRKLDELCRRFRVKRLALFGSVLREDFRANSDVDVLYEFEPDAVVGWNIYEFEESLSEIFGGRKIDLVPFNYVSPHLRDRILSDAQVKYAA